MRCSGCDQCESINLPSNNSNNGVCRSRSASADIQPLDIAAQVNQFEQYSSAYSRLGSARGSTDSACFSTGGSQHSAIERWFNVHRKASNGRCCSDTDSAVILYVLITIT